MILSHRSSCWIYVASDFEFLFGMDVDCFASGEGGWGSKAAANEDDRELDDRCFATYMSCSSQSKNQVTARWLETEEKVLIQRLSIEYSQHIPRCALVRNGMRGVVVRGAKSEKDRRQSQVGGSSG